MKFKHLLIYSLSAVVFVSCSKNNGNNFTFTPPVVDTVGTATPTPPASVTPGPDAPQQDNSKDNSNLLFGNPSGATAPVGTAAIAAAKDNFLINTGYYVESYNATKLTPNWVSWHLDATNTTKVTDRLDNFAAYAPLAALGFTAVQSNSYSPATTYGFDRGHNCPSADRTSSVAANTSTFFMINMIPQAPNNNQQTWGNFEDYLRGLTTTGFEIYIVMGSYGTGGTGSAGPKNTIGTLGINVPSNVWKIALVLPVGDGDIARVTSSTRLICINTPNINTINSNWKLYITSLADIEAKTGYNLLSILPKSVHDALAPKVDPGI